MNLKLLLKRGALLTVANWQTVAIQFLAETTFQVLLAVPILGAAVLVAVLVGGDLGDLLQGSLRDIVDRIARALTAEPIALGAFATAFAIALAGGSALMCLVKGGTLAVLLAAHESAGPIEREPVTFEHLRAAAQFNLPRFMNGCVSLFRRYLGLGLALMCVYALSGVAYLASVVYGYQAAEGVVSVIGWTAIAAFVTAVLILWITLVNLFYLLARRATVPGSDCPSCTASVRSCAVRASGWNLGGAKAAPDDDRLSRCRRFFAPRRSGRGGDPPAPADDLARRDRSVDRAPWRADRQDHR